MGYSYTDAKLTASFVRGYDDLVGVDGDRLPGVSKQQATVAADFAQPLDGNLTLHARFDASYRSDFWSSLPHSATAVDLPGVSRCSTRARGVWIADAWRVEACHQQHLQPGGGDGRIDHAGAASHRADFVGRRAPWAWSSIMRSKIDSPAGYRASPRAIRRLRISSMKSWVGVETRTGGGATK